MQFSAFSPTLARQCRFLVRRQQAIGQLGQEGRPRAPATLGDNTAGEQDATPGDAPLTLTPVQPDATLDLRGKDQLTAILPQPAVQFRAAIGMGAAVGQSASSCHVFVTHRVDIERRTTRAARTWSGRRKYGWHVWLASASEAGRQPNRWGGYVGLMSGTDGEGRIRPITVRRSRPLRRSLAPLRMAARRRSMGTATASWRRSPTRRWRPMRRSDRNRRSMMYNPPESGIITRRIWCPSPASASGRSGARSQSSWHPRW